MSERTVQKANYLSADTVQELNDQHGWFQYEDAQSDVSRAFANNAIHVFLGIAIEAEQIKQETGMSPRELAKHISDLESRIVELEKENTSLKNHTSLVKQTTVQQPLSYERILSLDCIYMDTDPDGESFEVPTSCVVSFARNIERAHGITKGS